MNQSDVFPPCSPAAWIIGFTGHRQLEQPAEVRRFILRSLTQACLDLPGTLVAYSSVASGADTLFLEACGELGIDFHIVLPFSESEFRRDFNEADWARAKDLIDSAHTVSTVSQRPDGGNGYLDAGLETVDKCDLLLAVWNEKEAKGPGGTADVVAYARDQKKPVCIYNPELNRESPWPQLGDLRPNPR